VKSRLTIHVINAGIGESIVIELPNGAWGVVDCYAPSVKDRASNATIAFLDARSVSALEFVCITHPHDDHYRGLYQLLERFPVRYFWRFGAFSGRDLRQIFLGYFKKTAASGINYQAESADELAKAFALVYQQLKEGRIEQVFDLSDVKPVYPVPIGSDPKFEIISIAPSTEAIRSYEEDLAKCFDPNGTIVDWLPRQRHNDVSVALLIRYGKARVILGGDVESNGWKQAQTTLRSQDFKAHGVKVSHHGSTTGYSDDLWAWFSLGGKPVAVVTPFRRFGLPKREALQHIRKHSDLLLCTCGPAILDDEASDFQLDPAFDFATKTLLKSRFRKWLGALSDMTGICSVSFDVDGSWSHDIAGAGCAIDYPV
jgi:beta-lactamase superfamily II metal-dependent hydrolase